MNKILLFISILSIVMIVSCNDDEEQNVPDTSVNVSVENSVIQKGPFVQGSAVDIQELDEDLAPTGRIFSTETNDDFGSFDLDASLNSNKLDLSATGFYFNEVAGELSQAQLTLRTYIEFSADQEKLNINILTTLARQRIKYLITEEGLSFTEAKSQAENEVLSAFFIPQSIIETLVDFETMDISQNSASNAVLLAVSVMIQGDNTVAQLSELITKIADDLEEDGTIDDPTLTAEIRNNSANIDADEVKQNLATRFTNIGADFSIPDFENYIDTDGDGTINLNDVAIIAPTGMINNSKPLFEWKGSSIPDTKYRFQLSENENFEALILDISDLEATQYELDEPLKSNQDYYWRISFTDETGEQSEWKSASFRYDLMNVTLSFPVTFQSLSGLEKFTWEAIERDNITYDFQIAADESFDEILFSEEGLAIAEADVPDINWQDQTIYYWRVRGSDENNTKGNWTRTDFGFNLPVLENISPSDQAILTDAVQFIWTLVDDFGITYDLQVSAKADFSELLIDESGLESNDLQVGTSDFTNGTTYYWRARMTNTLNMMSAWSEVTFFTFDIGKPNLLDPVNGIDQREVKEFTWTPVELADATYDFQLSTTSDFSDVLFGAGGIARTSGSEVAFPADAISFTDLTTYYWRVRAVTPDGLEGEWAETSFRYFFFTEFAGQPTGEVISSPDFVWGDAGGDQQLTFELQIASDPEFQQLLYENSTLTERMIAQPVELTAYGTYYWRVRATNFNNITSDWATYSFVLKIPVPGFDIFRPEPNGNLDFVFRDEMFSNNPEEYKENFTLEIEVSSDPGFGTITRAFDNIALAEDLSFEIWNIANDGYGTVYTRARFVDKNLVTGDWKQLNFTLIEPDIELILIDPSGLLPIISWNTYGIEIPGDYSHEVNIATDSDFSNKVVTESIPATQFKYEVNQVLSNNTVYYLELILKNENGEMILKAEDIFRASPGNVFLNEYDDLRNSFTFSFFRRRSDVDYSYEFQVSEELDFSQPLESFVGTIPEGESGVTVEQKVDFTSSVDFQVGQSYYYRIRLLEFGEPGEWSAIDSFVIGQ